MKRTDRFDCRRPLRVQAPWRSQIRLRQGNKPDERRQDLEERVGVLEPFVDRRVTTQGITVGFYTNKYAALRGRMGTSRRIV